MKQDHPGFMRKRLTDDRLVWSTWTGVVRHDCGWQNRHHRSGARHACADLRKADFRWRSSAGGRVWLTVRCSTGAGWPGKLLRFPFRFPRISWWWRLCRLRLSRPPFAARMNTGSGLWLRGGAVLRIFRRCPRQWRKGWWRFRRHRLSGTDRHERGRVMIFTRGLRVCLAAQPADLRRSFEGLALLVRGTLKEDGRSNRNFRFHQPAVESCFIMQLFIGTQAGGASFRPAKP